jgi:hypothetical protein
MTRVFLSFNQTGTKISLVVKKRFTTTMPEVVRVIYDSMMMNPFVGWSASTKAST